jgi:hypothetical protein
VASTPTVPSDPPRGGSRESFWYMGLYEYDVDRARQLVNDGREPIELEEDSVRDSVQHAVINEQHLLHVDPTLPGVIAHVQYRDDAGEVFHGHVLIDGHHRAARCSREQLPFLAYLLTEEESQAVLLRSPEDPFPRARVQPREEQGQFWLTFPQTGTACPLSEQQYFLFLHFDGKHTAQAVRAAYQARFHEPLAQETLNAFVLWAQDQGFLELMAEQSAPLPA